MAQFESRFEAKLSEQNDLSNQYQSTPDPDCYGTPMPNAISAANGAGLTLGEEIACVIKRVKKLNKTLDFVATSKKRKGSRSEEEEVANEDAIREAELDAERALMDAERDVQEDAMREAASREAGQVVVEEWSRPKDAEWIGPRQPEEPINVKECLKELYELGVLQRHKTKS